MYYNKALTDYKKKFPDYSTESSKWLYANLPKISGDLTLLSGATITYKGTLPNYLVNGKLYFCKYDLTKEELLNNASNIPTNKSSGLDQFMPFLYVDYIPELDDSIIWCLNFNFIPLAERERIFKDICDMNTDVLEYNKKRTFINQKPLDIPRIKAFKKIVFPFIYAIRPYHINLISNLYGVDSNKIVEFTTLNLKVIKEINMDDVGAYKILNGKVKEILNEMAADDFNIDTFKRLKNDIEEKLKIYKNNF